MMTRQTYHQLSLEAMKSKRIGICLAILGVIALLLAATSCCHQEQRKPAIIQLTERDVRDSRGHFKTPVHAVTGEPAITQQTIYRTASAAEMHGPTYIIRTKQ